jgi:hypothetical protein
MKNTISVLSGLVFLIFLFSTDSVAQVLDSENKIGITLSDGVQVVAYGRANTASSSSYGKFSNEFYYLPTNLRLSQKQDGVTPEFIFVKYTTDESASLGGTQ